MKRPRILPLLAVLPWLVTAGAARAAELVEGVAAIVGADIILLSELEQAVGPVLARYAQEQGGNLSPEIAREIRSRALQNLIEAKLISEYAERTEMAATPQEIDETVAGIAADEKITVEQIYAAAEQQGLPRNSYRRELGNQITRMKLMGSTIRNRVKVTDDQVKQVFEERYKGGKPGMRARVRQLLLPWPPDPAQRDFARQKAEQLRGQAEASGQFAAIAAQFGGTVTTLNQSDVTPEIAKYVFEPPPGTISPVIETPVGMQLFQVLERFDPEQIQFEDVEARLRAELQERGVEPEFAAWLKAQREESYIRVVAPDLQ